MSIRLGSDPSLYFKTDVIVVESRILFEKTALFRMSDDARKRHEKHAGKEFNSDYAGVVEGPK